METVIYILDLKSTVLTLFGYNLSIIEAIGFISGLISVYLASRKNILTWPTGIINEVALFAVFYQVQLYADMMLQVWFLYLTIQGWRNWKKYDLDFLTQWLSIRDLVTYATIIISGTIILGITVDSLPQIAPTIFSKPASYPYPDAFISVTSMVAIYLMGNKYIDSWYLWIIVDLAAIYLNTARGIPFIALMYSGFLVLAVDGFIRWRSKCCEA